MFEKEKICSKRLFEKVIDKQMYVRYNMDIETNVRAICSGKLR